MTKRLFHFSDDPTITVFEPRRVRVSSRREAGMEWLNGPLVWAIDAAHAPLYFLPRDCPRIAMWRTSLSTDEDIARFLAPRVRMTIYVEEDWLPRIETDTLWRYELPIDPFTDLADAGMHVAWTRIVPIGLEQMSDLPRLLVAEGAGLRPVDRLAPLRDAWASSLHVSGIRLRNAAGWNGT